MRCGGDHKITEDYYNDKEEVLHMELQKGRPQDTTGRLAKEIRTYDLLDQLGISYERIDHAPAMTMEDCQEIDEALQATVCKNLFLCNRQETAFYLLMIPDTKTFHTKDLSAQIGSARLSFAKPEYMEKFLDITPEFPIVKDTTPNMMNPRLYTTSYNKPQGQQFDDTAVLSFIKLQYT